MLTARSYVAASTRRFLPVLLGATVSLAGAAGAAAWPRDPYPAGAELRDARRFAERAPATVAFAVQDADGGVRGLDRDGKFSSASASKVVLLAGELRRLRDADERLDRATRSLLERMIRFSDNAAADSIYARVGDAGMERVARRAGMRSFETVPGYWGGAQVSAAELARFFFHLERNLVGPYRGFGKGLLATITPAQRWGIPAAAPRGWEVYFKGGWRPPDTEETSGPVTHQAALLRHRSGRRLAIAILTDRPPGTRTFSILEGITLRLLAEHPSPRAWPAL